MLLASHYSKNSPVSADIPGITDTTDISGARNEKSVRSNVFSIVAILSSSISSGRKASTEIFLDAQVCPTSQSYSLGRVELLLPLIFHCTFIMPILFQHEIAFVNEPEMVITCHL